MRIFRLQTIFFTLLLVCIACDSFNLLNTFIPPSDEVDKRFEASQAFNETCAPLVITSPTNDYTFFVSSDWHVIKHDVQHIQHFLSIARNCPESRFILALGDFVTTKGCIPDAVEAMRFMPSEQAKNDTVLATAGNHDLYFNQWKDYKTYFKTASYCFTVKTPNGQDLYIMLDSGSGTLGKKQTDWLKEQLSQREKYRHCIICTHTNFFRTETTTALSGNFPLEETAQLLNIFSTHNVSIVFCGHTHRKDDRAYNGVRYVITNKLAGENATVNFIKVTVSESINYTFSNQ